MNKTKKIEILTSTLRAVRKDLNTVIEVIASMHGQTNVNAFVLQSVCNELGEIIQAIQQNIYEVESKQ